MPQAGSRQKHIPPERRQVDLTNVSLLHWKRFKRNKPLFVANISD